MDKAAVDAFKKNYDAMIANAQAGMPSMLCGWPRACADTSMVVSRGRYGHVLRADRHRYGQRVEQMAFWHVLVLSVCVCVCVCVCVWRCLCDGACAYRNTVFFQAVFYRAVQKVLYY